VSRVIVVKLGGHALDGVGDLADSLDALAADLVALRDEGYAPVVVHGAGPQISTLLERLGIASRFVDGLRVTDDATMSVVAMVLGYVNLQLVAGLRARGLAVTGLTGADEGLVTATLQGEAWGRAGGSVTVTPAPVAAICERGVIPVVNPVGVDAGGHLVNCNADAVAGALAAATGAEALVLLSDVDQLRTNPDEPTSAVATVTRARIGELLADGSIREGMRPKVSAALNALDAGARRVVIANGTRPRAVLAALAGQGLFTEVTA
jgi:acetylglutamate kinase